MKPIGLALLLLSCAATLLGTTAARGDYFRPGDILVSAYRIVYEYTPDGVLVQQFSVPYPHPEIWPYEGPRGIAVDSLGRAEMFNGTFGPYVTTLTPAPGPGAGTLLQNTTSGWSTVNNISFGKIGVLGDYAYVTDMATYGQPTNGLIRFNLANFAAQNFALGTDYGALTVGRDGLVYAIKNTQGGVQATLIDVFDSTTLKRVRTIDLGLGMKGADLRALAVDTNGDIYAAGWDGKIYHLDRNGSVLAARDTAPFARLMDISLNSSGELAVGSVGGTVYLTDTSLKSLTSFVATTVAPNVNVTFVPATAAPEPGTLVLGLTATGALGVFGLRRRQSRSAMEPGAPEGPAQGHIPA